jgi:hypothetical protein
MVVKSQSVFATHRHNVTPTAGRRAGGHSIAGRIGKRGAVRGKAGDKAGGRQRRPGRTVVCIKVIEYELGRVVQRRRRGRIVDRAGAGIQRQRRQAAPTLTASLKLNTNPPSRPQCRCRAKRPSRLSMRHTKVAQIYRKTRNLRAAQLCSAT